MQLIKLLKKDVYRYNESHNVQKDFVFHFVVAIYSDLGNKQNPCYCVVLTVRVLYIRCLALSASCPVKGML